MMWWTKFKSQFTGLPDAMALIILALIVGYVFKSCHRNDDESKIPPAIVKTIDSLDRTKPEFEQTQDSLRRAVSRDTVVAGRHKVAAKAFGDAADRTGARGDSLAGVARTALDSAAAWRKAYEERTRETVQLRMVIAETDSAYQSERSARITLSNAYGADTLRRIAVEKLNAGLRKTIDDLERPCKFARFISCPSRTTTGVVSAIVGAGAVMALKN